jgi:hypothetical protein
VLSRGNDWIFAQNIGHVVKFVGLDEAAGPVLSPTQLMQRLDQFMSAAIRIIPQMPDDRMETHVPNRPRSYRVLGHHIFRIPDALLQVVAGATLTYDMLTAPPPDAMQSGADIAAYGNAVLGNLRGWWNPRPDKSGLETVETYYGKQLLHEYLERTTWHCGQHVRQWDMLLGTAGITPAVTLQPAEFADLPMPGGVWDG